MNTWKSWLQSLPDKSFFDLYRHYLSPLVTPYHKEDLIQKLTLWLQQDKVQDRIIELLSQEDLKLLSVILIRKSIDSQTLSQLFKMPIKDLLENLRNLQERLLVISNEGLFSVNPILKDVLIEKCGLGIMHLVSMKQNTDIKESLVINDSLLTAILLFLKNEERLLQNQGSINKKMKESFQNQFATLIPKETDGFLTVILKAFLNGGILLERSKSLELCSRKTMIEFASMSPSDRKRWIIFQLAPLSIREDARGLLFWLEQYPEWGLAYDDWDRLLIFPGSNNGGNSLAQWDSFLQDLLQLSVLVMNKGYLYLNTHWVSDNENPVPPLIQPNGDINLLPQTPLSWVLPYTTSLISTGSLIQCHLDRKSFKRGCSNRLRSNDWIDCIEKQTGYPLEPLLKTRLQEWDKEFFALELEPMICLKLRKEKKSLVESSGLLKPFIIAETSTGDWLMESSSELQWLEILKQLEIEYYPETVQAELNHKMLSTQAKTFLPQPAELDEYKQDFKELLVSNNELSEKFDDLTVKELMSRQERKILLFKDQIKEGMVRTELRQAKGLDFNSKMRLLETALTVPVEYLELTLPAKDMQMEHIIFDPEKMEGKGQEAVLIGVARETGKRREIPVRRIIEVQRFPYALL